jgi:hypothetical protein
MLRNAALASLVLADEAWTPRKSWLDDWQYEVWSPDPEIGGGAVWGPVAPADCRAGVGAGGTLRAALAAASGCESLSLRP